jgi:Rrf2 family protein
MKLTMTGDYAVRALVYLATKKAGEISTTAGIAREQDIPPSFLAKVMQSLARTAIVKTRRGKAGGFSLVGDGSNISLLNVVEAVEGPIFLNRCLTKISDCNRDSFCPSHQVWKEAQSALINVLDKYTVLEIAGKQKKVPINNILKSKKEVVL